MDSVSFAHSFVAMISDSAELRAVRRCWMDFQEMGPPQRTMRCSNMDRTLKRAISVPSGTEFPVWLPQQASE